MGISENLSKIISQIPENVQLVAVSKTKPNEMIMEAYNAGHRAFGENRPQDLKQKHNDLPKDIEWHFIGHPQSKQVKYFAPFVHLIHGIDSLNLLEIINKEAIKNQRVIDCLLQFYIAQEDTKFGLDLNEAVEILNSSEYKAFKNVRICGVMGMATFTEDFDQVRDEFKNLVSIFEYLKHHYFNTGDFFKEISMGMSADFEIAIEEGSTMIRIGSDIFGSRVYH